MKKLILALLFSSSVCFGQTVVTTPIANFPNISNPLSYYLLLIANPGVTNYNITMSQLCAYLITQGFPTNNQQRINANAIWVSPTNSSFYLGSQQIFGNGTIGQPFYGDYDTIINACSPNTIVNLLSGTFVTRGCSLGVGPADPVYQAGLQIVGSGIDTTIIQRSSTYYPQQDIEGVVYSVSDRLRVQDLTIDANSNISHTNKVECLLAAGNNNYIQNVKFINACNGTTNNGQECFVVYLAGLNNFYSTYGNTIKNCIVSNLSGSYLDGITVSGEYLAEGNRIYMPLVTSNNFTNTFYAGINTAYSSGGKIVNNYSYGGTYNIYQDTGASTNLIISQNQLLNSELGLILGPRLHWTE